MPTLSVRHACIALALARSAHGVRVDDDISGVQFTGDASLEEAEASDDAAHAAMQQAQSAADDRRADEREDLDAVKEQQRRLYDAASSHNLRSFAVADALEGEYAQQASADRRPEKMAAAAAARASAVVHEAEARLGGATPPALLQDTPADEAAPEGVGDGSVPAPVAPMMMKPEEMPYMSQEAVQNVVKTADDPYSAVYGPSPSSGSATTPEPSQLDVSTTPVATTPAPAPPTVTAQLDNLPTDDHTARAPEPTPMHPLEYPPGTPQSLHVADVEQSDSTRQTLGISHEAQDATTAMQWDHAGNGDNGFMDGAQGEHEASDDGKTRELQEQLRALKADLRTGLHKAKMDTVALKHKVTPATHEETFTERALKDIHQAHLESKAVDAKAAIMKKAARAIKKMTAVAASGAGQTAQESPLQKEIESADAEARTAEKSTDRVEEGGQRAMYGIDRKIEKTQDEMHSLQAHTIQVEGKIIRDANEKMREASRQADDAKRESMLKAENDLHHVHEAADREQDAMQERVRAESDRTETRIQKDDDAAQHRVDSAIQTSNDRTKAAMDQSKKTAQQTAEKVRAANEKAHDKSEAADESAKEEMDGDEAQMKQHEDAAKASAERQVETLRAEEKAARQKANDEAQSLRDQAEHALDEAHNKDMKFREEGHLEAKAKRAKLRTEVSQIESAEKEKTATAEREAKEKLDSLEKETEENEEAKKEAEAHAKTTLAQTKDKDSDEEAESSVKSKEVKREAEKAKQKAAKEERHADDVKRDADADATKAKTQADAEKHEIEADATSKVKAVERKTSKDVKALEKAVEKRTAKEEQRLEANADASLKTVEGGEKAEVAAANGKAKQAEDRVENLMAEQRKEEQLRGERMQRAQQSGVERAKEAQDDADRRVERAWKSQEQQADDAASEEKAADEKIHQLQAAEHRSEDKADREIKMATQHAVLQAKADRQKAAADLRSIEHKAKAQETMEKTAGEEEIKALKDNVATRKHIQESDAEAREDMAARHQRTLHAQEEENVKMLRADEQAGIKIRRAEERTKHVKDEAAYNSHMDTMEQAAERHVRHTITDSKHQVAQAELHAKQRVAEAKAKIADAKENLRDAEEQAELHHQDKAQQATMSEQYDYGA
eukprot:TRINITY_DN48016_c0_g1_i1.p1 TRINITY_DN48016_c0_g1~~TRINITY_DN48016_c0_g1_i1.p1  ORF type:complete len:1133 (+),score=419.48 TRINITY_DN48016_c0_g1_i1:41-3439(+)